jgi:hypothetical protein
MKKVLLISVSALALSAGAAFAQSSPVITGSPPANGSFTWMPTTTNPGQVGASVGTGNTSFIQQIGGENSIGSAATPISQDSDSTSGNYSEIYQGTGWWNMSNGSAANLTQSAVSGAENSSRISQTGSSQQATVSQYTTGPGNFTSVIEQSGSGNSATVNQGQSVTSGGITTVTAISGGATSSVSQTGTDGLVNVLQLSSNASSAVVQSGSGDGSTINVNVQQTGGATNGSTVWQQSDTSIASVTQGGLAGTNTSYVTQYNGANNDAVVQQTSGLGTTNYSYIDQQNGAFASLTQTASANNTSNIIQNGASFAYVKQGH